MQHFLRDTKQDNNVLKKQLGALLCSERPLPHMNRDQPHKLGQPVNHGENPVHPITTRREVSDKVHTPAVEPGGRYWEGLQQPCRRLGTVLLVLTDLTLRHMALHRLKHVRPEDTCRQKPKGLGYPEMTTRRGIMSLI